MKITSTHNTCTTGRNHTYEYTVDGSVMLSLTFDRRGLKVEDDADWAFMFRIKKSTHKELDELYFALKVAQEFVDELVINDFAMLEREFKRCQGRLKIEEDLRKKHEQMHQPIGETKAKKFLNKVKAKAAAVVKAGGDENRYGQSVRIVITGKKSDDNGNEAKFYGLTERQYGYYRRNGKIHTRFSSSSSGYISRRYDQITMDSAVWKVGRWYDVKATIKDKDGDEHVITP